MSQYPDERGAELRELFFETAQEILQSLNEEALKLERQPGDAETVRTIRRIVHTLKGDAAATGFSELSELAHEFEDALAIEGINAQASLAEIALSSADAFTDMLHAYRNNKKAPAMEALRKKIRKLSQPAKKSKSGKEAGATTTPAPTIWTEYEKLATQDAAKKGQHVYHVCAEVDPACAMPIAVRQLLLNALAELGTVLGARPEAGSAHSTKKIDILLASDKGSETIAAKSKIPTVIAQVRVDLVETAAIAVKEARPSEANAGDAPPAQLADADENSRPASVAPENILRVEAERIDNVLNLVGELIIGKSMLQQAMAEYGALHPKDPTRARFADAMSFQARVLNDLQRAVMKVRMVPVEQLFRRFPRMVRDIAKQCGREVELQLSGQDTDLDKSLLDSIAEPITHLVRNAIGHGIESAEERTRNGKPPHGTLRLDAYHHGNQVVVEISDDGRGIDVRKVRACAMERGVLSSQDAGRLSETEALQLIFKPGFSTADEITEIAGRGVGLDVVQTVLHRLKGSVEVETHAGKGTRFRLRLPLTLAIIKALLFRVEHRLYAIPLNAVAEIARSHESDVHHVDNREVLQLRDYVLPLIRLGKRPTAGTDRRSEKIFILVISTGERKFGLLVNALEGGEELVIKPLNDQTVDTDLVSGASILGDGRVVLILNLASVVDRFTRTRPDVTGGAYGILLSHTERTHDLRAAAVQR